MRNIDVKSKYEVYLSSIDFDKKRQAVLQRDHHRCIVCGRSEHLNIHHLTYIHIYHENLDELITLCQDCHETYHKIQKMADYINEKYWEDIQRERENERQKIIEENKNAWNQKKEVAVLIEKEIKEEYLSQDYCSKNGDLDMCSWPVLNKVIEMKCAEHEYEDYGCINKSSIRDWFLYRRYELLLRCLDNNISFTTIREQTKFDPGWLFKWYRKDKLKAKLNEEKFLIKEEENNEET